MAIRHSLRNGITCGLFAFTLVSTVQARASDLFNFPNFSNTSGLTFAGSATTTTTADGTVLRLTPASGGQSGAAYSTSSVTLGASDTFSTQFQFRFTNPGGIDPADGITFVLAASPTGLGGAGYGIGYAGVPHSVAVEFDTYNNNGYGLPNNDGNSSNHVAIDENGDLSNLALANVYGNGSCGFAGGSPSQNPNTAAGCMSNGDLWTALVNYDGSHLSVSLKDPAKGTAFQAISNYAINISSLIGTSTAYVGFTSGTGSGWEDHDILNWELANTATLPTTPSSGVPEPSALLLIGAGLTTLATIARRHRR